MASRNERKRLAKARHAELERAVNEAFALEAARDTERQARNGLFACYPAETRYSPNRELFSRSGTVQRGAFIPRQASPPQPLTFDGNASGYGQLRKRWL